MIAENSLSHYSVDPRSEFRFVEKLSQDDALRRIEQNFLAYGNEVLRDEPVSIGYSFWFGPDQKLYIDPSLRPEDLAEKGFKSEEREGKFVEGFKKNTELLRGNPDKIVMWYSPPGKAAFVDDPTNEFSQINFIYGQLYLQYFDGQKVNAVALKVNDDDAVKELLPPLYDFSMNLASEQSRTYFFLQHPVQTDLSINEFLDKDWNDVAVYKDKEGQTHRLHEILTHVRAAFSGEETEPGIEAEIIGKLKETSISHESLFKSYMSLINFEMNRTGKNYIQLAGSCGGKIISRDSVSSILGLESPLQNLFSSDFRKILGTDESSHYPDYECPHCHKSLSGESKKDKSSWRSQCDRCGEALNC